MSKSKKPKEWVPEFSADFIVGYSFMRITLDQVAAAFMAGAK
jgi:hypothetical protein